MRQVTRRPRRGGFTLIELMIALMIGGFVMAAAYKVLRGNQLFYAQQNQILTVQQNVRAVAQILPGELRELDAGDGDIIAMSDTSITIKAMRGMLFTCKPTDKTAGYIYVRNALQYGYRAVDPTRDSVLVFRDGNVQLGTDDRWLHAPIAATSSATCTDGTAATRYTLTGMVGGVSQLDSVWTGSPVRTFEVVNYRLYNDGTGTWWLGVRSFAGGAWGTTSPVAGPLRALNGIFLDYRNISGSVTTDRLAVVRIRLTVRGQSQTQLVLPGGRRYYTDSVTARVTLRNNVRY